MYNICFNQDCVICFKLFSLQGKTNFNSKVYCFTHLENQV